MKRLHRFLLESYLGPLVMTFFISLFILLMQFLWKMIDDLAGKGLDWTVIAELIVYASARLVPMALPLAVLLSSIMTFGNLGENFELTAIKSAGISLQRFMAPLIYLIIAVSIAAFYYSDYIIPYTNLKAGALIYDVKHQRPELQINEGIFYNGIEGYSIKIGKKNHKTNLLQHIMVYDHTNGKENVQVTVADSGYMRMTADETNIILTLYHGSTYEEVDEPRKDRRKSDKKYPHQRYYFDEQTVIFELLGLDFNRSDEDLFKDNYQMLNISQLVYFEDSLKKEYAEIVKDFSKTLSDNNYFKREENIKKEIEKQKKKKHKAINEEGVSIKINDPVKLKKYRSEKNSKLLSKTKIEKNTLKAEIDSISDTLQSKKPVKLVLTDSVINKDFYIDSAFNNLTISEKNEAIGYALTYARAAQGSVEDSKKHFNYKQDRIRRHQIEWHRKFALSFACFVFFFIGAPLGAIVRKGGFGTPVVISIFLFIFYYILSISGEKFVREGVLPAYIGMWISSFVLMPLGIFLTYKATTDSVILNADTYFTGIKKLVARFSKKKSDT
ncbi:MAG: LptF/LptG family permease [Bacteroidales bacterium]